MRTAKINQGRIRLPLLVLLFSFVADEIACQKIDSLENLLPGKTGVARFEVLFNLGYEYVDIDHVIALRYANLAFKESKEYGDSLNIVRAGRLVSLAFRRMGEFDSSINVSVQVLPIARRNCYISELKTILSGLAIGYTFKAYYDKALEFYFESLELKNTSGDKESNGAILNNVGLVYYKMKDYYTALSYFRQALQLHEIDNVNYDLLFANISLCYAHLGNFMEAKKNIAVAVNGCADGCPEIVILQIKFCQGVINYELNELLKAESYFLNSYYIAKKLGNKRFQLDNIVYLSEIYIKLNRLSSAEKYLNKSQELIASGSPFNLELIKIYKELFNLNTKAGNYRKASRYLLKYSQLRDSIFSEELTTNLMKVEAEFLERENTAKIVSQSKIMALNDEIIFRQRIINACIIIVAMLLTVITFILVKRNRYKKKMNDLLELKVKERTVELEQNQSSLHNAITEQAVFLEKVSSEVKSSLASVKGLCSLGLSDRNDSETKTYFNRILTTSEQLLGVVNIPKRDLEG